MDYHQISLVLRPNYERLPLLNISTGGAAARVTGALSNRGLGDWVDAVLFVDQKGYPLQLKIVYLCQDRVGFQLAGDHLSVSRAISDYLRVEIEAHHMSAVKSGTSFQKDADGQPYWMLGLKGAELYFVQDGDRVVCFYGTVLSHYFEGGGSLPLRFGRVSEGVGTDLVVFDPKITSESIEFVWRFLQGIPGLSDIQKKGMSAYLRNV